jgi:nucleotide-binding universal stress UspA family protein
MKRILVAVDGSEPARRAVRRAADLAAKYGAELVLVNVLPSGAREVVPKELADFAEIEHIDVSKGDLLRAIAEQILRQAEADAREAGVAAVRSVVETGDPASAIAELARTEKADLIVMGRRGLGALAGLLLGSVSHKVTQLAACDCLMVA